jgi:hypothetical protein
MMSDDQSPLGFSSREKLKTEIVRDVFLQLAGMEALAGLSVDLQRLANDVLRTRNSEVIDRLGVSERTNLATMGDTVTIDMLEERIPYAGVIFTFRTAVALSQTWPLFKQAVDRPNQ